VETEHALMTAQESFFANKFQRLESFFWLLRELWAAIKMSTFPLNCLLKQLPLRKNLEHAGILASLLLDTQKHFHKQNMEFD
jgi:hypothetical protein